MKKTHFDGKFAIAMSQEDGCLVIVRHGDTVVGSLSRAQTLMLCQGCIDFIPPLIRETPKLSLVKSDEASP